MASRTIEISFPGLMYPEWIKTSTWYVKNYTDLLREQQKIEYEEGICARIVKRKH